MQLKLKRAYETAQTTDGYRVLVDRLWPRGISKEKAHFDLWEKDLAPSTDLRKWFGHDPAKWGEFKRKYIVELNHNKGAVDAFLSVLKKQATVTLIYAAKDTEHNEAVVLKDYLQEHLKK